MINVIGTLVFLILAGIDFYQTKDLHHALPYMTVAYLLIIMTDLDEIKKRLFKPTRKETKNGTHS